MSQIQEKAQKLVSSIESLKSQTKQKELDLNLKDLNLSPATKVSDELLDMMDRAVAMELQVSIQYMMQHIQWSGIKGFAFHEEFRTIAIQEMIHAEDIAERLFYLGRVPTTTPTPINVGTSLKEMLAQNEHDERATVELYKEIIDKAKEEKDQTTVLLFQKILSDEEDHHDTFISVLENI